MDNNNQKIYLAVTENSKSQLEAIAKIQSLTKTGAQAAIYLAIKNGVLDIELDIESCKLVDITSCLELFSHELDLTHRYKFLIGDRVDLIPKLYLQDEKLPTSNGEIIGIASGDNGQFTYTAQFGDWQIAGILENQLIKTTKEDITNDRQSLTAGS